MIREKIDVMNYANDIVKAFRSGVLLTTKTDEKVNTMVIGWGGIGVNWGKTVFSAYVREHRFTRGQLDKNPEFTISVPIGEYNQKIIAVCGGKSGRDIDKVIESGMTLVDPEVISVPAVKEFPLTLECRVMYSQKQDLTALSAEINEHMYPKDVPGTDVKANRDAHITYFGEIVDAYILK